MWRGRSLSGKPVNVHNGKMIMCLNILESDGKEYLFTGSTDKTVKHWNPDDLT